jgi:hypothetical protein
MSDSTTLEIGKSMNEKKLRAAISAIQNVVIQARMLAYHNAPHEQMVDILDQCEYLPGLLLESENNFKAFGESLHGIGIRFPSCRYIAEQFATACGYWKCPPDR